MRATFKIMNTIQDRHLLSILSYMSRGQLLAYSGVDHHALMSAQAVGQMVPPFSRVSLSQESQFRPISALASPNVARALRLVHFGLCADPGTSVACLCQCI